MVWAGIWLVYSNYLPFIRLDSMSSFWYRYEALDPTARLYALAVGPLFRMMMHVLVELFSSKIIWRVRGLSVWNSQRTRPNLIILQIFRIPSVVLHAYVSHSQQLSQSCNKFYRRMEITWHYVGWSWKAWSHTVKFICRSGVLTYAFNVGFVFVWL